MTGVTPAKRYLRELVRRFGYELLHRDDDAVLAELRTIYERLRLSKTDTLRWADTLARPAAHACVRSMIHLHKIDLVLDVGANQGQFAQLVRHLGYRGDIVSFEPLSRYATFLEAAATADGRWRFLPLALGSTSEERELHVFSDDSFASLYAVNERAHKRFGGLVTETHRERVRIRKLDDIWPDIGGNDERRVLLKADTQGHDLAVLMGAINTLARVRAIVCETALQPIYAGVPSFGELLNWLRPHGFVASGIFPISHDPEDLSVIELDCCFTRQHACRL